MMMFPPNRENTAKCGACGNAFNPRVAAYDSKGRLVCDACERGDAHFQRVTNAVENMREQGIQARVVGKQRPIPAPQLVMPAEPRASEVMHTSCKKCYRLTALGISDPLAGSPEFVCSDCVGDQAANGDFLVRMLISPLFWLPLLGVAALLFKAIHH